MAGVEIRGFEELRRNAERLGKAIAEEAVTAAEDAAARVVRAAVESAAPRKSGRLASSVRIFEGVDRKALTGSTRRRLLIGPEKRKGFYGYFLDVGWNIRGKRVSGTGWMTKAATSVEQPGARSGSGRVRSGREPHRRRDGLSVPVRSLFIARHERLSGWPIQGNRGSSIR